MLRTIQLITIVLVFTILSGCGDKPIPKPRGFFRISFPEKAYKPLGADLPYTFQMPVYGKAGNDPFNPEEKNWITIDLPVNNAQIHISYKEVHGDLNDLMEDSRTLVYKHTQKASSITENIFINPGEKVYGTLYTLKGNAASPMQFFLTDSTKHFLRGALYIREVPNWDSLKPVITFLTEDMMEIVKSTHWN